MDNKRITECFSKVIEHPEDADFLNGLKYGTLIKNVPNSYINGMINHIEPICGVAIQSMIDETWEEFKEWYDQHMNEDTNTNLTEWIPVHFMILGASYKTKTSPGDYVYIWADHYKHSEIGILNAADISSDDEARVVFMKEADYVCHGCCAKFLPKEFFKGEIVL